MALGHLVWGHHALAGIGRCRLCVGFGLEVGAMSGGCPIILVADASPEIGWGHAMRTLAVAQALEDRGEPMVWVTNTLEAVRKLGPPCPVRSARGWNIKGGDTVLFDLPPLPYGGKPRTAPEGTRILAMVDSPEEDWPLPHIKICPHFGAESWDFGQHLVCTGPRWMPLRDLLPFSTRHHMYNQDGPVLAYRAPKDWTLGLCAEGPEPHELAAGSGERWWEKEWSAAVVPASTIAYECMFLGIPVLLTGDMAGVGQGMIDAGAACFWAAPCQTSVVRALRARHLVDGRGAGRVAALLMEGGWTP